MLLQEQHAAPPTLSGRPHTRHIDSTFEESNGLGAERFHHFFLLAKALATSESSNPPETKPAKGKKKPPQEPKVRELGLRILNQAIHMNNLNKLNKCSLSDPKNWLLSDFWSLAPHERGALELGKTEAVLEKKGHNMSCFSIFYHVICFDLLHFLHLET